LLGFQRFIFEPLMTHFLLGFELQSNFWLVLEQLKQILGPKSFDFLVMFEQL